MSTQDNKQKLAHFKKMLEKFKNIEEELELGKNIAKFVAALSDMDFFKKQLEADDKLSSEQKEKIKTATADRNTVILVKKNYMAKVKKVILDLNHNINTLQYSKQSTEDQQDRESITRTGLESKNQAGTRKESNLSIPFNADFYNSHFSQSGLRQIIEYSKTGGIPPSLRRFLSVFFIDMVGFSALAETIEPEKVMRILNEFFNQINLTVQKHHGDIDKFMGDAILVTFQKAEEAVRCGIEILLKDLDIINLKLSDMDIPDIQVHLGVNTGWILEGYVGSKLRRETTVIGDGVNIAARVQGLAPPNKLWVTSKTLANLGKLKYSFEQIGSRKVKGRIHEVMIYEHKRKIPSNHSLMLYEPNLDSTRVLTNEMNNIGINNIIAAITHEEVMSKVSTETIQVMVLGPSFNIDTFEEFIQEIESNRQKPFPIIPIIRQKLDPWVLEKLKEQGMGIYIPIYKERNFDKLVNSIINENIQEIPMKKTPDEPDATSASGTKQSSADTDSEDSDKLSMTVVSQEIILKITTKLDTSELDELTHNLNDLWLYSYHQRALPLVLDLSSMPPDKFSSDVLDDIFSALSFISNSKLIEIKVEFPDDKPVPNWDKIKSNYNYHFKD